MQNIDGWSNLLIELLLFSGETRKLHKLKITFADQSRQFSSSKKSWQVKLHPGFTEHDCCFLSLTASVTMATATKEGSGNPDA